MLATLYPLGKFLVFISVRNEAGGIRSNEKPNDIRI
jgi:hypothetical protein